MRLERGWPVLGAVLWLTVACGGGESPAGSAAQPAEPTSAQPAGTTPASTDAPAAPKAPPRDYAVVWPEVLAKRDRIRELMAARDLYIEEMKGIAIAIEGIRDLCDEMHELAVLENKHAPPDMGRVRVGLGDVKIATATLHGLAMAGLPGKFHGKAQAIDSALRSFQTQFPKERLGIDVQARADFGTAVRRPSRRG